MIVVEGLIDLISRPERVFWGGAVAARRVEQGPVAQGSFAQCCAYTPPQLCRFFALQNFGRWPRFPRPGAAVNGLLAEY